MKNGQAAQPQRSVPQIIPVMAISTTSEPQDWRSPQNNNLWQGISGVNNPCPSGFRLPIADEWQTEMNSWSSKNAAGAFASPLKLVMAGIRSSDGTVYGGGNFGMYWSSTAMMNNAFRADGTSSSMTAYSRANGLGVRCIKDERDYLKASKHTISGKESVHFDYDRTYAVA